jgi:hypothetical protein
VSGISGQLPINLFQQRLRGKRFPAPRLFLGVVFCSAGQVMSGKGDAHLF